MINCPCGFGKNIKEDQRNCPICGIDLTPLHRLKMLPKFYVEQVNILLDKGHLDEAITKVTTAISLDPTNLSFYILLGNIYMKKLMYSEAISQYAKALNIDSQNEEAKQKKEKAEDMRTRAQKRINLERKLHLLPYVLIFIGFLFITTNFLGYLNQGKGLRRVALSKKGLTNEGGLPNPANAINSDPINDGLFEAKRLEEQISALKHEVKEEKSQHAQMYIELAKDALERMRASILFKKKWLGKAKHYISVASEIDPLHKDDYEDLVPVAIIEKSPEKILGNRGYIYKRGR